MQTRNLPRAALVVSLLLYDLEIARNFASRIRATRINMGTPEDEATESLPSIAAIELSSRVPRKGRSCGVRQPCKHPRCCTKYHRKRNFVCTSRSTRTRYLSSLNYCQHTTLKSRQAQWPNRSERCVHSQAWKFGVPSRTKMQHIGSNRPYQCLKGRHQRPSL